MIVTIPDHMHAAAAMHAMALGKHVYVQKPLAHTVWECRQCWQAAEKYKVATQMGNQGYSNEGTRQCAEMIWSGEIGNVTEVHAWTNRPVWPQGALPMLPSRCRRRATFDWDLWLGIAKERPYSDEYLPFTWRGFYDFGSGALGDMACHILGAPNMALRLTAPTAVECISQEGKSDIFFPAKSVLRFDFPARGSHAAGKDFLVRRDARRSDRISRTLRKDQILGDLPEEPHRQRTESNVKPKERQIIGEVFTEQFFTPRPQQPRQACTAKLRQEPSLTPHEREVAKWMSLIGKGTNGSLFVGDKGMITTGTYGEKTRLLPVEKMRDYEFPPSFCRDRPAIIAIGFGLARAACRPVRISVFRRRLRSGLRWERSQSS